MTYPLQRRDVLAAATTTPVIHTLTEMPTPQTVQQPRSATPGWPQFQRDAANTGHNPHSDIPTTDLERRWRGFTTPVRRAPILADGSLYVASTQGTVAYDLTTGEQRWAHSMATYFPPAFLDGTLYTAAPEFITPGHRVLALDPADGTEQWAFDMRQYTTDTPGVKGALTVADTAVFFPMTADEGGQVVALEAADGSVRWTHDSQGEYSGAPAVADGTVYVHGGIVDQNDGIQAFSTNDGTLQWETPISTVTAGLTVADGTVYGTDHDTVFALDATTGDVLWRTGEDSAVGDIDYSPVVAGDQVVVGATDGTVFALDAATGSVTWQFDAGDYDGYDPVRVSIVGDAVLVGSPAGTAYALARADGSVRWEQSFARAVTTAPVAADGLVVLGTEEDNQTQRTLHVFESPRTPSPTATASPTPTQTESPPASPQQSPTPTATQAPTSGTELAEDARTSAPSEAARGGGGALDGLVSHLVGGWTSGVGAGILVLGGALYAVYRKTRSDESEDEEA